MLSSNYSTRKVCHLCEAVKYGAGPPFDDFGAGACHRNMSRDHNSYILGFATPPPLSLIPGFQLCMLVCDPMHCLHLRRCLAMGCRQRTCTAWRLLLVVLSGTSVQPNGARGKCTFVLRTTMAKKVLNTCWHAPLATSSGSSYALVCRCASVCPCPPSLSLCWPCRE